MEEQKILRKKLASILLIILCFVLVFAPVENPFINFKTPESVFKYDCSGKIDNIVYGKESCTIYYHELTNETESYITRKSDKGYKMQKRFMPSKIIMSKSDKNGVFIISNVSGTNDYCIEGIVRSRDSEIKIVDSNNNEINYKVTEIKNSDEKAIINFSYIENYTSDYYLLINNEKVDMSE